MENRLEEDALHTTEPRWAGLSGAIGGCLTALSVLSFCLCLGASGLGSIVRYDELGYSYPAFPWAIYAFYALALFTVVGAVLGGTALGIRAFGQNRISTSEAMRVTFVSALLPLRYLLAALQALVLFLVCPVFLYPVVSIWWPIGAFVALSILQGALLLVTRVLGGPGTVQSITESETSR